MPNLLHIETATPVCSVALSIDGLPVSLRETDEDRSHATRLTLFIEEVLKESKLSVHDLDAISLTLGPGSYTGLRIGTSVVKGLAYASGKPVIGIPTLQALAANATNYLDQHPEIKTGSSFLLCPMIDARRMEVYMACYHPDLTEHSGVAAEILSSDTCLSLLEKHRVCFFGSGSFKARDFISHPNALFLPDVQISANAQIGLAVQAFQHEEFLDVAYFEPAYLKEFMASMPRNLLGNLMQPRRKG